MNEVRLGIIGMGNIGTLHAKYLGKVERAKLTAVCDWDQAKLDKAVTTTGAKGFLKATDLMESGLVDAVLISVPHYDHIPLTIAAFERGLHVITEKPIAVTAKDALRGVAAHKKYKKLVWAAMFNQRTNVAYRRARKMIQDGDIGPVRRSVWIITNWFRSQAYYNSGGWRATWAGEGGGVLINQCPHNLDLWQWLCGMPNRVTTTLHTGKFHDIEVEDEVITVADYASGAHGVFITTTGDAPGTNRLEITGDAGTIITDGSNRLEVVRTHVPVPEHCRTTKANFKGPEQDRYVLDVEGETPQHIGITRNFVAAVLDGEPLIAPAEEGLHSVELINAMIMSGLTKKPVPLPTPHEAYERLLKRLCKTSRYKDKAGKAPGGGAAADMAASF